MTSYLIFTDVSLDPRLKLGMGAYLIVPYFFVEVLPDNIEKSDISQLLHIRRFENTSSTKLEVETILWALENFTNSYNNKEKPNLSLYTDSQCVAGLLNRRKGLEEKKFLSQSKNVQLKHASLYQKFYEFYDELEFEVVKVTGHSRSITHDTIHRIFSFIDREVRHKFKLWMKEY